MTFNVQDADSGNTYAFPDNATDKQIADFIQREKQKQSSSVLDKAFNESNRITNFGPLVQGVGNVEQGLASFPVSLAQLPTKIATPFLSPSTQNNKSLQAFNNFDMGKWLNKKFGIGTSDDSLTSQLERGAGAFAVPMSLEGQIAASIAKSWPALASGPVSILGQLLTGGVSGLINEPDVSQKPQAAVSQSLLNVVAPAGVGFVKNLPRNTKKLVKDFVTPKTDLTPEQLAENLKAAHGTQTPIGDVLNSPALKKTYENVVANLPFSGAQTSLTNVNNQVKKAGKNFITSILGTTNQDELDTNLEKQAENLLKSTLGTSSLRETQNQLSNSGEGILTNILGGKPNPVTATNDLVDHLNNQYTEENAVKNGLFNKRDEIADNDRNFNFEAPRFAATAKEFADSIGQTSLLKNEPQVAKVFDKLIKYTGSKRGVSKLKLANQPKLKEATLLKATLNKYANSLGQSPDFLQRSSSGIYKKLASALNEDIDTSIEKSGNDELRQAHETANQNYAKNFAPFLNENIYKHIRGKSDPDTILNSLIKTGGNTDRSRLLKTGTAIPGPTRSLLAKAYFGRAFDKNGRVVPQTLTKLIDQLGPNQFSDLIPDAQNRKALSDFSPLSDTVNFFSKGLSQDGTIQMEGLNKSLDELMANPAKFRNLVPNEATRQQWRAFSDFYKKSKYFRKALKGKGGIDLPQLARLNSKLSESAQQTDKFLSKPEQEQFNSFATLHQMNKDIPKTLANQPTGKTLTTTLLHLLPAAAATFGTAVGGIPGAMVSTGAAVAMGRGLNKLMTDQTLRESIVKDLLKPKPKAAPKASGSLAPQLAKALANSLAQTNQRGS